MLYALDKAVRLLLESNPNIVGLFWLRDEECVHRHPAFDRLLAACALFSSQAAANALPDALQSELLGVPGRSDGGT